MADFVFNIAKGRVVEFYNRVEGNDPTDSALILVPLSTGTTAGEAQDYDTLSDVLGGTANEQTSGNWARITLTDAAGGTANTGLAALPAPDDTGNAYSVSLPSCTWSGPTTGNDVEGLLVCYDSNTGTGTDANVIPLTYHDFAVTADDNDVILNAGAFFTAS